MTPTESAARNAALEQLRELFPVGSTATTRLEHVTRSGMSRAISVLTPEGRDVTQLVATATGRTIWHRYGGLKVGGCGMDMGFHVVYCLSSSLYPEGHGCIGTGCPSNDHANGVRNEWHANGGYAVRQSWTRR